MNLNGKVTHEPPPEGIDIFPAKKWGERKERVQKQPKTMSFRDLKSQKFLVGRLHIFIGNHDMIMQG